VNGRTARLLIRVPALLPAFFFLIIGSLLVFPTSDSAVVEVAEFLGGLVVTSSTLFGSLYLVYRFSPEEKPFSEIFPSVLTDKAIPFRARYFIALALAYGALTVLVVGGGPLGFSAPHLWRSAGVGEAMVLVLLAMSYLAPYVSESRNYGVGFILLFAVLAFAGGLVCVLLSGVPEESRDATFVLLRVVGAFVGVVGAVGAVYRLGIRASRLRRM
jgi:hypothetical protein